MPPLFQPFPEYGGPLQQTVFPVVSMTSNGRMNHLGTAFVIQGSGLLMTAKHVIQRELAGAYSDPSTGNWHVVDGLFIIYATNDRHQDSNDFIGGLIPIHKTWCCDELDIALCWLNMPILNGSPFSFPYAVRLGFSPPSLNDPILGCGYYGSHGGAITQTDRGIEVNYAHNTARTSGVVTAIHHEPRDTVMLRFPSFQTSARFQPGLSGGPIFQSNGSVCGVICSSMRDTQSPNEYVSQVSMLWPALGIQIEIEDEAAVVMRNLKELCDRGWIAADESLQRFAVTLEDGGSHLVRRLN